MYIKGFFTCRSHPPAHIVVDQITSLFDVLPPVMCSFGGFVFIAQRKKKMKVKNKKAQKKAGGAGKSKGVNKPGKQGAGSAIMGGMEVDDRGNGGNSDVTGKQRKKLKQKLEKKKKYKHP